MALWKLAVAVVAHLALIPAGDAAGQVPRGNQGSASPGRRETTGQLGASFNNPGLQNTIDMIDGALARSA